ncbi:hypothetical protein UFOVP898_60 [uncultured Caudovirales phage]|uniref:Uncharacterized protein n=1 Tax=uncultured Caudovirales phage TaxID=2100421 RepID=A0A6J5SB33_9CAUD|nr:hypothetical protein UFOVP898_60 [uncultured Caudovirales phage]CAB4176882.1 hypothetical protein UFOVP985_73 [uncultured Caudovirales phage]CAB4181738.1 hypothetical protein UFOVP1073_58 [uncultured Caudovirales phage]CAB4197625.1 hypothetical protein UFOVP1308_23 [uncultured Caudovirales phage]CAB4210770.1 hypothetical protein UFOVP1423_46 [uncultured Caudovirales phage]
MDGEPRARLWGAWVADDTENGLGIVSLACDDASFPHFLVFADPVPGDKPRQSRNRRAMCHEIASYMSGTGRRPPWLDDFVIRRHNASESLSGAMVVTLGPWIPGSKGSGVWRQESTKQARALRRKLLRVLLTPDLGIGPCDDRFSP